MRGKNDDKKLGNHFGVPMQKDILYAIRSRRGFSFYVQQHMERTLAAIWNKVADATTATNNAVYKIRYNWKDTIKIFVEMFSNVLFVGQKHVTMFYLVHNFLFLCLRNHQKVFGALLVKLGRVMWKYRRFACFRVSFSAVWATCTTSRGRVFFSSVSLSF